MADQGAVTYIDSPSFIKEPLQAKKESHENTVDQAPKRKKSKITGRHAYHVMIIRTLFKSEAEGY